MPENLSHEAIRVQRETRAWSLRQRGWTEQRIADDLGVSQATVSRMLARIERRVLAQLSRRVELQKVTSTKILDHIRDESLQAWEKSKRDRKRAVKKSEAGHSEATIVEAVTREGDPAHLDRAMAADDRIRRLWGLDAPPAKPKDDDGAGLSVSGVAARIAANELNHEATPDDEPGGLRDDPTGGEAVAD